jgi:predicted membrane protein
LSNLDAGNLGFIQQYNSFSQFYISGPSSCLVDIRNEVTNKIRLMNPFDYEIQVNQNTVVGEAEKVESQQSFQFWAE